MAVTNDYLVKRIDASLLTKLADLHALVYGRRPGPQHFQKKYDTAYTGVGYVGFMAFHPDGEPLAYYGVLPCFMQYKGALVLAAQSADTMTNPKYRYKGLFVELSLVTFELCKTLGITFVFGFPNQNSYHGAVNKLGWQMTHTMEAVSGTRGQSSTRRGRLSFWLAQTVVYPLCRSGISPIYPGAAWIGEWFCGGGVWRHQTVTNAICCTGPTAPAAWSN